MLTDQEAARSPAHHVLDAGGRCRHLAAAGFRIPSLHGQALHKMLLALTSAVRHTTTDIEGRRSHRGAAGQEFCQLIEAIPGESLPKAGGCSATIVVTMTLDQLLADLESAGVCASTPAATLPPPKPTAWPAQPGSSPRARGRVQPSTSAADAACTPSPAPGDGTRDRGCTTAGCDRPPAMCHAHHDTPGPTAAAPPRGPGDCCAGTTTRVPDPRYSPRSLANGQVSPLENVRSQLPTAGTDEFRSDDESRST